MTVVKVVEGDLLHLPSYVLKKAVSILSDLELKKSDGFRKVGTFFSSLSARLSSRKRLEIGKKLLKKYTLELEADATEDGEIKVLKLTASDRNNEVEFDNLELLFNPVEYHEFAQHLGILVPKVSTVKLDSDQPLAEFIPKSAYRSVSLTLLEILKEKSKGGVRAFFYLYFVIPFMSIFAPTRSVAMCQEWLRKDGCTVEMQVAEEREENDEGVERVRCISTIKVKDNNGRISNRNIRRVVLENECPQLLLDKLAKNNESSLQSSESSVANKRAEDTVNKSTFSSDSQSAFVEEQQHEGDPISSNIISGAQNDDSSSDDCAGFGVTANNTNEKKSNDHDSTNVDTPPVAVNSSSGNSVGDDGDDSLATPDPIHNPNPNGSLSSHSDGSSESYVRVSTPESDDSYVVVPNSTTPSAPITPDSTPTTPAPITALTNDNSQSGQSNDESTCGMGILHNNPKCIEEIDIIIRDSGVEMLGDFIKSSDHGWMIEQISKGDNSIYNQPINKSYTEDSYRKLGLNGNELVSTLSVGQLSKLRMQFRILWKKTQQDRDANKLRDICKTGLKDKYPGLFPKNVSQDQLGQQSTPLTQDANGRRVFADNRFTAVTRPIGGWDA